MGHRHRRVVGSHRQEYVTPGLSVMGSSKVTVCSPVAGQAMVNVVARLMPAES